MHPRTPGLSTLRATATLAGLVLLALIASACSASTTTLTPDTAAAPAAGADDAAASGSGATGETEPGDAPEADSPDSSTGVDATAEPAPPTATVDETTPEDASTLDVTDPDTTLDAGEASVVLLDAGSEPRRELRFNIAGTCGEITELTQTQSLTQVANGLALPATGPVGTVTSMETSATPNGDNYDIRSVIIGASAAPGTDPALAAALDAQFSSVVGVASVATITKRGLLVPGSNRVEGAGALGEMGPLVEDLTQAQNPLPVEAVGLGARWETRSAIDVQGMLVETVTVFELVSVDETLVTLDITGTQIVDVGAVMNMQGTDATVTQWDVTTTGSITMDLATISPISGLSESFGTQGFSVDGTTIVQEISIDVVTRTEPNTGCTGRTFRP